MEKLNANLHISNDSLKEYQKELYAKILNDDDFHILVEEGYTNQEIFDNVMKFSEYLSDIKKARKIRTYEDCLKANMTQRLILVRNGKIIERACLITFNIALIPMFFSFINNLHKNQIMHFLP